MLNINLPVKQSFCIVQRVDKKYLHHSDLWRDGKIKCKVVDYSSSSQTCSEDNTMTPCKEYAAVSNQNDLTTLQN